MFSLRERRVTLIGGGGFIGHNLALDLVGKGARVTVIDSLQVNNLYWLTTENADMINRDLYIRVVNERFDLLRHAGVEMIIQDARDYQALSRLLNYTKPQAIVHLAAVSNAGRSNKDPFSTFDHSLRTLENALDCARNNVEHFVYLSSSMAYGNFQTEEVREDHPLDPIGIYGALKLAGERMVIAYNQVFDLAYTIIRPSALYGERCISRRVGQVFIENALMGSGLRVEGDGSDRLDFTYIDDLVQGLERVIQYPEARNQIFNLTYGKSRMIRELVDVIHSSFPDVAVEYTERDKLMPFRGTLNVDKARELIGYEPQYPIEKGFPMYIDWYRRLFASIQDTVATQV